MNKTKNFFTKEIKKYDTSWMWILSVLALFGLFILFWNLLAEGIKYEIVYFATMIFSLFLLSPFLVYNFKRRALYDPKLNMINIQSVQDMGKYLNKMFLVEFDSLLKYRMYLQSTEFLDKQEDKIFIYLEPLDVDFVRWDKLLREMLGDQPVAAVTFVKEKEGDRIGIKFWTFGSNEGNVIYPLRSQW